MARLFVDREEELRVLESAFSSGRPELVVIYGRRRIGKTMLVKVFLKRRRGFYLVVNYSERTLALRDFSRQVSRQVGVSVSFEWFSDLLEYLARMGDERPLIVIDEFQRLAGTGLLAELQSFWDECSHVYNPMIVLVGSGVGVVEKVALSYNSPIYGRVSRVLRLKTFGYREARVFMKGWDARDRVRGYAVFGGTPYYLSLIDPCETLEENVKRLLLEPGAPLAEEPLVILRAETREPDRYAAILEAISSGCTRLTEISSYTGIPREQLSKYIHVLEEGLGLVERTYPLGMEGKPRYTRYRVADLFFEFWFSEVYPRTHMLGLRRDAEHKILQAIDKHAAKAWERIALEHMMLLRNEGLVSFDRIGGWWWKGVEIDLVAIDEETSTVYFVECKWGEADEHVIARLIAKAQHFPWRRGERKERFIVYAGRARVRAKLPNTEIYTLEEVDNYFEERKPSITQIE